MGSNKLLWKLGYFLIASVYLPIALNYLSLQHFFDCASKIHIKEYIRYNYPLLYAFSVMKIHCSLWGILFMESQNHKKNGLREARHAIPVPAHIWVPSVAAVSTFYMLIHWFIHAFNKHFSWTKHGPKLWDWRGNKTQSQAGSLWREGVKLVQCCVRASTGYLGAGGGGGEDKDSSQGPGESEELVWSKGERRAVLVQWPNMQSPRRTGSSR